MLVTLEGYNTDGFSFKKSVKRAVSKAAPIVKKAAPFAVGVPLTKSQFKKGFSLVKKTAPMAVGIPLTTSQLKKGIKTAAPFAQALAPYAKKALLLTPEGAAVYATAQILKKDPLFQKLLKEAPGEAKEILKAVQTAAQKVPGVTSALPMQDPETERYTRAGIAADKALRAKYDEYERIRQKVNLIHKTLKRNKFTEAGKAALTAYNQTLNVSGIVDMEFDGFSFKKAVKSVKKVVQTAKAVRAAAKPVTTIGHKILNNPAVQAAAMTNPYTAAGMTAYKTYRKVKETYGDQIMNTIKSVKGQINQSPEAKAAIIESASRKSGVAIPPEGLTPAGIETMPPEDKKKLAKALQEEQGKVVTETTAKKTENAAVDRMEEIIKKDKEKQEKIKATTFTAPEDSGKWTAEDIERFNESQRKGATIQESYGDILYKQGKLMGATEINKFWETDPEAAELNKAAGIIYASPKYLAITYPSQDFVLKVLRSYIYGAAKLSSLQNKSMYYTGTTEPERKQRLGNVFIRLAYMFFKGIATEDELEKHKNSGDFDYDLRDKIWIIIAQLKTLADGDKTYAKFLKPFDYQKAVPIMSPGKSGISPLMIAAAGVGALLLLKGKK